MKTQKSSLLIVLFIILLNACCHSYLFGQLKVTSSGDVGIGYNSPSCKLEIRDSDPTDLKLFVTSTYGKSRYWSMNYSRSFGFGIDSDNKGHIYNDVNNPKKIISFDGTYKNVSIGTATIYSGYKLYVLGNFNVDGDATCRDGFWASSDLRLKSNVSSIKGA